MLGDRTDKKTDMKHTPTGYTGCTGMTERHTDHGHRAERQESERKNKRVEEQEAGEEQGQDCSTEAVEWQQLGPCMICRH